MSKGTDRTVFRREDGKWVNQRGAASRPAGVHDTQKAAAKEARGMLKNQGGGELTIDFCGVPPSIYDGLRSASSKGSYYDHHIRHRYVCF